MLRQLRARDPRGLGLTARSRRTAELGGGGETADVGFFTDSSICIGCKACEVACRQWNMVPDHPRFLANSYDNSGSLDADTWRHVAFVEQQTAHGFRWLMSSDVCKHCREAACLEVCPTGALFRSEFGTVVLQADVCNGCGYCVPACPFGVISRREGDGRAFKCTLCYDRLGQDMLPACAKACPTGSIGFGPAAEMERRARDRLERLRAEGVAGAQLYGTADAGGEGVGGAASIFLLLDRPEIYGLPSEPETPARGLAEGWGAAAMAAGALVLGVVAAVVGGRR